MGSPNGGQLGPYRLLSQLGAGGFGEVHLALDTEGRTVAVKVLHPHVAADSLALTRLAREVETMRRVRGPHIAEVLDASLSGQYPYIVTRYVQGRPLSSVLVSHGPIQGEDLLRLARGLAEALESIHRAGVVHRDLKPANVILADHEPFVIDFGIACAQDAASVTASGAVVGTPGYLSPEVLEGAEAGPEADVFAWAATLAFAASGRQPYGSGPPAAVAYRVVHHEPDLSGVPDWLAPLLRECLQEDPGFRPVAAELVARLDSIAPSVAAAAPPAPAPLLAAPIPHDRGPDRHDRKAPRRQHADHVKDRDAVPTAISGEATREWKPRRVNNRLRSVEEARARRREQIRRRWVIGTGVFAGLIAAAASQYLPEVSLLILVLYGLGVLIDAGFGLLAKSRTRVLVDLAGGAGVVALWAVLSSVFSPLTLLLAVGGVLFLLTIIALAS
ncbi:serine/threonine-protein kinase [Microtetraspora malaysiensis]|uniref:serine/threonine-protein kinase n=1 Tax=Microtetraspora malaysiensis TaxID=161358 RepID=UPI003D8E03E9